MLQHTETPHRKKSLTFSSLLSLPGACKPKKINNVSNFSKTDKMTHHIWIMERLTGADEVFTMRDIINTKSFIMTVPGEQHIMY